MHHHLIISGQKTICLAHCQLWDATNLILPPAQYQTNQKRKRRANFDLLLQKRKSGRHFWPVWWGWQNWYAICFIQGDLFCCQVKYSLWNSHTYRLHNTTNQFDSASSEYSFFIMSILRPKWVKYDDISSEKSEFLDKISNNFW